MKTKEIEAVYRKARLQGLGPLDSWDFAARQAHAAGVKHDTYKRVLNRMLIDDEAAPLLVPLTDEEVASKRQRRFDDR